MIVNVSNQIEDVFPITDRVFWCPSGTLSLASDPFLGRVSRTLPPPFGGRLPTKFLLSANGDPHLFPGQRFSFGKVVPDRGRIFKCHLLNGRSNKFLQRGLEK